MALAASLLGASVSLVGMTQMPAFSDVFGLAFALCTFLAICATEARA